MSLVDDARHFATVAHAAQTYGDGPYTAHLAETAAILQNEVGVHDEALLAAAWLHDVVEDTGVEPAEVRARFGERVAALVAAVTDDPGDTRAERKAGAYVRIAATPDAVLVKLADRLANVRACRRDLSGDHIRTSRGERKIARYREEHPGLHAAIASEEPGDGERWLWEELGRALEG